MKKLIITLVLLFSVLGLFSNNVSKIDSLKNLISQERPYLLNYKALSELSILYYQKENFDNAIKYKKRELLLHIEQANDSLIASCNERLGMMYYHIGNYKLSAQYFIKGLRYFESKSNYLMIAQTTGNLANVYTRLENHKQALKYLFQSKYIFEKKEFYNTKSLASLFTNIGLAYAQNKELDSAMYYYKRALDLVSESDEPLYVASILNNIGEVDFELKNFEKALKNYQKSSLLFSKINHENGKSSAELNIAKVKIELGQFKQAIKICNEVLPILKRTNSLFFIAETEKHLSDAYSGLEKHELALKHLENYIEYNDSLKGTQILQHITNIEMQYLAQKEEQRLALQEQQSKIRENELKLKQVRLYILIGGILVLLAITVLIIIILKGSLQRNKLKQQVLEQEQNNLKNELFFKQKGIENFATYIQEKNKLLTDLKNEIKIITKSSNGDFDGLKKLVQIVNQSLHTDNDRKELELKIDQAHQEFINRLKQRFPLLTKTEIRLCSLLLLELSTKEIASIMNIESSSVKMSRNRLRKKLGLPSQTNLTKFLLEV